MKAMEIYSGSSCAGTPDVVAMWNAESCADATCGATSLGNGTYYLMTTCEIPDQFSFAAEVFGDFNYVIVEYYNAAGCEGFKEADAFPASGSCQVASGSGELSMIASMYTNGSATISFYDGDSCGGGVTRLYALDSTDISSGGCIQDHYKFYSSMSVTGITGSMSSAGSSSDTDSSAQYATGSSDPAASASSGVVVVTTDDSSSGLSSGVIAGIAAAAVVLLLVIVMSVWTRRRKRSTKKGHDAGPSMFALGTADASAADSYGAHLSPLGAFRNPVRATELTPAESEPRTLQGMWDDAVIATARIPREKVLVHVLISRGGFGEVYRGSFNGQDVAIKMLLPETRKSVKHLNEFLGEMKLMASLEHEHIVRFVGVAWDSLADLCVVSEYMKGGDLRALLTSYEERGYPVGFDDTKLTIALHVAHALTYLHSLQPPVLHRDLKSKNILLSSALEAKLADFGTSRERADDTMTANVGTSLWMAPEVMLGERYDDKADMFSFGVVLSELDVHTVPYSHAKANAELGRKVPETAILQMVALGRLRVEFSANSLESVVELGHACVSLDPKERPTSSDALFKLHTILSGEAL